MFYIREIMEMLHVDFDTAERVMQRMNINFSECSQEEFNNSVWFTWDIMQASKQPW